MSDSITLDIQTAPAVTVTVAVTSPPAAPVTLATASLSPADDPFVRDIETMVKTAQETADTALESAAAAQETAAASQEAAAAAQETATAAIPAKTADANSILYAVTDASPAALALPANTFPARSSTGDIVAKPVTDAALALLDDADAAAMLATLGAVAATGATPGATSQAQAFEQGVSTPALAFPEVLDVEMVVNGDFATQTDWTVPAGWSWVAGKPKYTSGVLALAPAVDLVPVIGAVYRVAVTFAEYTPGETAPYMVSFGGAMFGSSGYTSLPVVYYLSAITATSLAITIGNGGASVKVVNVSIQRVLPAISRTPATSPLISASGLEINAAASNTAFGARLFTCRIDGAQVFSVSSPGTIYLGLATTTTTAVSMCGTTQLRAYPSTPLYLANSLGVSLGVVGTCSTLVSDANAILALRQATTAMAFRVYGTYTGTSSLEALEIKAAAGSAVIQTMKGSAGGTARNIEIRHGATSTAGVITAGTLVATFAAAGVTIPGTLGVTGTATITGRLTANGGLAGVPQALTGSGAANLTTLTTALTTNGAPAANAITLADGANGQIKTFVHVVDGGSAILNPTTKRGWSTATFYNVGDSLTLQFLTGYGWAILSSKGTIIDEA